MKYTVNAIYRIVDENNAVIETHTESDRAYQRALLLSDEVNQHHLKMGWPKCGWCHRASTGTMMRKNERQWACGSPKDVCHGSAVNGYSTFEVFEYSVILDEKDNLFKVKSSRYDVPSGIFIEEFHAVAFAVLMNKENTDDWYE